MATRYLMESEAEAQRLENKTSALETRRQLELVGLRAGARALDAGCGTGAVARVMAELVGPAGRVVALDGSAARLAAGARIAGGAAVAFAAGDVYAPPLREGTFDFIWSRFLFEYLGDPDRALGELVRLLAPGGKIVVGELDGNAVFHHPIPADLEADLGRLIRALQGRFDPFAGRKVYARYRRAGLADVRVHLLPYHLYAGAASEQEMSNWVAKFDALRAIGPSAFGSAEAYDRFGKRFLDLLRDPESLSYSILFLVEGTRRMDVAAS